MDWKAVADAMTNRTTKQCRERWMNVLDPSISRCGWSNAEIHTLFRAQADVGNKWAAIAARLPGRPETAVKNTFYAAVRREERRSSCAASGVAVPPPFHPAVPGVPEVAAILAEKGLVVVRSGSGRGGRVVAPVVKRESSLPLAMPATQTRVTPVSTPCKKRCNSMSDGSGSDSDSGNDSDAYAVSEASRDSKRRMRCDSVGSDGSAGSGHVADDACSYGDAFDVEDPLDFNFMRVESEFALLGGGCDEASRALTGVAASSVAAVPVVAPSSRGHVSVLGMADFELPTLQAFLELDVSDSTLVDDFAWFMASTVSSPVPTPATVC